MIAQQPENNIDPVPQLRRELYDLHETRPDEARKSLKDALDQKRISPSEAYVIGLVMSARDAANGAPWNGYESASP